MKRIYHVVGIPGVGKSHYITTQKQENDCVIDLLEYQNDNKSKGLIASEYLFYADIERKLRDKNNRVIFCESAHSKSFRRKAIAHYFKTIANGLDIDAEFHLVLITATEEKYLANMLCRFPHREMNLEKDLYSKRMEEFEQPSIDEGWDTITVVNYD